MDFAISCKAFIVKRDKLLLIKRRSADIQSPSMWEIPGGRIEPGEDPYQGLLREVKEEISINIKICRPLSIKYFTRQDRQTIIMLIFICKPDGNKISLSQEHTDYSWTAVAKAISKITPFFKSEVKEYIKYYKK